MAAVRERFLRVPCSQGIKPHGDQGVHDPIRHHAAGEDAAPRIDADAVSNLWALRRQRGGDGIGVVRGRRLARPPPSLVHLQKWDESRAVSVADLDGRRVKDLVRGFANLAHRGV